MKYIPEIYSAISVLAFIAISVFFLPIIFSRLMARRRFVFSLGYWVPHEIDMSAEKRPWLITKKNTN